MIPDPTLATIEEILSAPSDQAILELIEARLELEKRKRGGVKMSRAAGGTILILEQEPRSSRSGPMTLAILVKIPEIESSEKTSRIVTRDGRYRARGVVKAFIIESLLDWFKELPERYLLSGVKVVFYKWHENSLSALDQVAARFPMDHTLAWFMEPTSMLLCPLENGFGALSINFPSNLTSDQGKLDLIAELADAITEHFKPVHPMYPLDPKNLLSHRFLPGAEIAIATMTRNRGEMKVSFTHHPLSDEFMQGLVEFINAKSSELGIGEKFRVTTNFHYGGAKFNSDAILFKQFIVSYKKIFEKEPYLDWHVHPSIASCIYKHHPDAAGFILGPGDPFFLNDDQEAITIADAAQFRDILDAIGNEFLFRV
ncbi:MAG TPA: hypothetical protein VKM55_07405 [Candidatus Lokiarchaeia archaeon]|nr:hypothetical protein [Candidatus Lokiarchaeia archaeon]